MNGVFHFVWAFNLDLCVKAWVCEGVYMSVHATMSAVVLMLTFLNKELNFDFLSLLKSTIKLSN